MLKINKDNYHLYLNDEWWNSLSTDWRNLFEYNFDKNGNIYEIDKYWTIFNMKYIENDKRKDYFMLSLKNLKYCVNLRVLKLINLTQLSSIEGIENLTNIEVLVLAANRLYNLDINNLINLKELHVIYNKVSSLKGLEKCINLKYIYFMNTRLSDLDGIENFLNLKTLVLRNNYNYSLLPLKKCTNLEVLICELNNISSLEGLENCFKLKYLNCLNNKFEKINLRLLYPLRNCYNLEKLYMDSIDSNLTFYLKTYIDTVSNRIY